jgi:CheY-like chemotaxis protein
MRPIFLVVDDHQLYRTTFCALLQLCCPNAQIVEAGDASQALALFPLHSWDAIILDYQLPTLSGGDLARHLRARAQAQGLPLPPLILMSTQPDAATFARAIGARAFLPKPVELTDLQAVLATIRTSPAAAPGQDLASPLRAPATGTLPLRRAPASSSRIDLLRSQILSLVHQTIRRFPAPHPAAAVLPRRATRIRVGDYLVHLGYLTHPQLARALQAMPSPSEQVRLPIGFTLVAQELVPSPVLSAVLLQQFRDRLAVDAATAPRFIGEQLLIAAQLTPTQLAWALQEQLDAQRSGRWVRLSEIIAEHGWHASPARSTPTDVVAPLV